MHPRARRRSMVQSMVKPAFEQRYEPGDRAKRQACSIGQIKH